MTDKSTPIVRRRLADVARETNSLAVLDEIKDAEVEIVAVKITTEPGIRGSWRKATISLADGTVFSTGAGSIVAILGDLSDDDLPLWATFVQRPSPTTPDALYWTVE